MRLFRFFLSHIIVKTFLLFRSLNRVFSLPSLIFFVFNLQTHEQRTPIGNRQSVLQLFLHFDLIFVKHRQRARKKR